MKTQVFDKNPQYNYEQDFMYKFDSKGRIINIASFTSGNPTYSISQYTYLCN